MWWYIGIAVIVIIMIIILYFSMPEEHEENMSKKIGELIKTDMAKAREVAKNNDMKIFEAMQQSDA